MRDLGRAIALAREHDLDGPAEVSEGIVVDEAAVRNRPQARLDELRRGGRDHQDDAEAAPGGPAPPAPGGTRPRRAGPRRAVAGRGPRPRVLYLKQRS